MSCEYKDTEIELSDEIKAIIYENLSEKSEEVTVKVKSCTDCTFYNHYWNRGGDLHCCGQDYDMPVVSRDIRDLYDNCQIDKEYTTTRRHIKQYGIIHHKPSRYYKGSIEVVDFSSTTFEWDGHNPDVDYDVLVSFSYSNQEEADKMMELALQYYHDFNLNGVYCKKVCYG